MSNGTHSPGRPVRGLPSPVPAARISVPRRPREDRLRVTNSTPPAGQKTGFAYWTGRVLEEHSNAGGTLPAEPIHHLRVSLRRCIVIAEETRDLDPTCA